MHMWKVFHNQNTYFSKNVDPFLWRREADALQNSNQKIKKSYLQKLNKSLLGMV